MKTLAPAMYWLAQAQWSAVAPVAAMSAQPALARRKVPARTMQQESATGIPRRLKETREDEEATPSLHLVTTEDESANTLSQHAFTLDRSKGGLENLGR